MLETSYDLFKGKLNGNPMWIGTSELLDEGVDKLAGVADGEPGEYFLYNGGTGLVVATLLKMVAGPTRIVRYWT
jgi:hypothetical protein